MTQSFDASMAVIIIVVAPLASCEGWAPATNVDGKPDLRANESMADRFDAHGGPVDASPDAGQPDAPWRSCPGGDQACPEGTWCRLDVINGTYDCVSYCEERAICGDGGVCCPFGSRCEGGTCPLGDLFVREDTAAPQMDTGDFGVGHCALVEGCVNAPGMRRLLRFDTETPNIGEGDVFVGLTEKDADNFEYSNCHSHYHLRDYATYRLVDQAGNVVAPGHKQSFCLRDSRPFLPDAPSAPKYDDCWLGQGIQAGWADVYERSLDCQWVDVTDVAPGDYFLEITLNPVYRIAESDYSNNVTVVPVMIPP